MWSGSVLRQVVEGEPQLDSVGTRFGRVAYPDADEPDFVPLEVAGCQQFLRQLVQRGYRIDWRRLSFRAGNLFEIVEFEF